MRLFRACKGSVVGVNSHDMFIVNGPIKHLLGDLLHHKTETFNVYVLKIHEYSSTRAAMKFKEKEKVNYFKMLYFPLRKFIHLYVFKKNYKEGFHGVIICGGTTFCVFLLYAKLCKLYKNHAGSS